ncbi:hypothetical protein Ancab_019962 [Ancistrocladus abbreviatus]
MASQEAVIDSQIALTKYTKRVILKCVLGRSDQGVGLMGQRIVVGGWVKSAKEVRKEPSPPPPVAALEEGKAEAEKKDVTCGEIFQTRWPIFRCFMKLFGSGGGRVDKENVESVVPGQEPPLPSTIILQIGDGSCVQNLQVVVDPSVAPSGQIMLTGTCIVVEGVVQQPSVAVKHVVELKAEKILHLGVVDNEKYPLSKKRVPLDALRDWAHFRPRTTTNYAFLYVQVPIITATDSEGFSERFLVTSLTAKTTTKEETSGRSDARGVGLETIKASIKEKSDRIEELKRTDSNREALLAAIQDLKKTNDLASQLEAREKTKETTSLKSNVVTLSGDYFPCEAYLTVSGRLHLESYACALGHVYSFGPRFRADTSESAKHVAEMWMVEAEMAFAELDEAMSCATDLLKFLCKWVLDNCSEDMKFVLKRVDKTVAERLQSVTSADFEKISYAAAVDALKQVSQKNFVSKIEWGLPLTEEHENYLADEIYKTPVIIYNYPKELKPFYVRLNDDGKTVAAFDLIIPKVGALIRGSQNEERVNMLNTRVKELGLPTEKYEWYLDLRRHGTVKHSGFTLGFDYMVLLATGITDVRNVVPFPRTYGKINN